MGKNFILNLAVAGVLVSSPVLSYPRSLVKCPETLSQWMQDTLTYQAEGEVDNWKTPEETIEDKGGDCEDFGFLAKAILKDLNYTSQVIWVYGRKYRVNDEGKIQDEPYSHAICVFKNRSGKYQYISNQYLIEGEFKTLESVVKSICIRWIWYKEIDIEKTKYKLHKRKK